MMALHTLGSTPLFVVRQEDPTFAESISSTIIWQTPNSLNTRKTLTSRAEADGARGCKAYDQGMLFR
jgi:hypothetical protein